jgi:hypothetical protein
VNENKALVRQEDLSVLREHGDCWFDRDYRRTVVRADVFAAVSLSDCKDHVSLRLYSIDVSWLYQWHSPYAVLCTRLLTSFSAGVRACRVFPPLYRILPPSSLTNPKGAIYTALCCSSDAFPSFRNIKFTISIFSPYILY